MSAFFWLPVFSFYYLFSRGEAEEHRRREHLSPAWSRFRVWISTPSWRPYSVFEGELHCAPPAIYNWPLIMPLGCFWMISFTANHLCSGAPSRVETICLTGNPAASIYSSFYIGYWITSLVKGDFPVENLAFFSHCSIFIEEEPSAALDQSNLSNF